jgi:hypothetical protein
MDAGRINEDTLEELQQQALKGGDTEEARLVDIPRLLIVDDASAFPGHGQALRCLLEAPTFREMTCVIVGPPAASPELDLPLALDFHRVPVLWVGDPRGVGWRIGRSKPDRITVSPTDPDGSKTVADVLDALMDAEVYEHVSAALSALPYRFGAPALLPWLRWPTTVPDPVPEPTAAEPQADEPQADEPQVPAPPFPESAPSESPPESKRRGNWRPRFMLRRRLSQPVAAGPAFHAPEKIQQAPEPPPEQPTGDQPRPDPVSGDDLAHVRWLISAAPEDDSFRQLCSARQVIMLGGDARQAKVIRFAPAAARDLIEFPARDSDVVWTADEIIGVIRLVPLRDGLVRFA